eukprot:TRINITY_DN38207_c0_g1_i1.p2 TRINITY_DN38207_c0_g1~~TRINITY_DN38207_c0_g1_i1.p2  ORF type:complete len:118 (-),score=28.77 TRINITY_DN38207_c0_g1_i1:332-685(-)
MVAARKGAWLEVCPDSASPKKPTKQMVSAKAVLQNIRQLVASSQISDANNMLDNLIDNEAVDDVLIDVDQCREVYKPTPTAGASTKSSKRRGWGTLLGLEYFSSANRRVDPLEFNTG